MNPRFALGMDTSTRKLGLALVDEGGAVIAEREEATSTHATRLVPALEWLLASCGAGRGDLCAIGAVTGPGSFTGLRIGLASALGLSRALSIPAYGLQSLRAIALAVPAEGAGLAVMDARRSQLYCQGFLRREGEVISLGEPRALAAERVLYEMPSPMWAAGDGVALVRGWPAECRLISEIPNLAVPAAREALAALASGRAAAGLLPTYVRPPDVRLPAEV